MDVKESKYARNRQRWFVLAVLCLFVPFAWIVSIAIFVELFRHRQDGEIARQAELAAGNLWGPHSQVGPGMVCGWCHKPLSPVWTGKCEHCRTSYAEATPVPRPNQTVTA
jgi:hypothetical protein